MRATSFLNCNEVIVKSVDGNFYRLDKRESKNWINDFLYWVAGQGENVRNIKDGKIEDGNFVNNVKTYYDLIPHRRVNPSPVHV